MFNSVSKLGMEKLCQALFICLLKHHGATVGERDNIKEAKPDTDYYPSCND